MSEFDPVAPAPEEPRPASSSTPAGTPVETQAGTHATPPPPPASAGSYQPPVVPPAPPRKSRTAMFFLGAFSGCLIVFVLGFVLLAMMVGMADGTPSSGEFSFGNDKVAILPIEGEIVDSREAIEMLERFAENDGVKAIVVRINSPGGAIAPSQEIYSAIRATRARSRKPIIASMDSVAASGGYYIAVACDEIVANPGTITGSIGVILQWFEMKELVQWAKMKPETITSGQLKAAGSPFREMSPEERQYFQAIVNQLHSQFVRAVADGRKGKISPADVARLADGRVFTGEQAHGLKLVDRLGSIDDAVNVAGRAAGIKGEPDRVWPRRREGSLLELLSGDTESSLEKILTRRMPRFLYRW
jgi:protease-4